MKHKEKLVLIGYALAALGALSYVFVDTQAKLVGTQVVLGLSEAVLVPAFDAVFSEYLDKRRSASEWGDQEALYYFTTAIGALAGGYIAAAFGFRTLFLAMFALSVISIPTAALLLRRKGWLRAGRTSPP